MKNLRDRCVECRKCKLSGTRTKVVFGEGCLDPDIAFVGEAPGQTEDEQGRPFVGKAGELLEKMIVAMGYSRDRVYICNTVACRPPGNRKPEEEEIKACKEFFVGQLRLVRPKAIVALGASAVGALLKTQKAVKDLRGQWFDWEGTPVRVTYHPAYLLRSPNEKSKAWEDLQAVAQRLKLLTPRPGT